jgi:hypothetical protein
MSSYWRLNIHLYLPNSLLLYSFFSLCRSRYSLQVDRWGGGGANKDDSKKSRASSNIEYFLYSKDLEAEIGNTETNKSESQGYSWGNHPERLERGGPCWLLKLRWICNCWLLSGPADGLVLLLADVLNRVHVDSKWGRSSLCPAFMGGLSSVLYRSVCTGPPHLKWSNLWRMPNLWRRPSTKFFFLTFLRIPYFKQVQKYWSRCTKQHYFES